MILRSKSILFAAFIAAFLFSTNSLYAGDDCRGGHSGHGASWVANCHKVSVVAEDFSGGDIVSTLKSVAERRADGVKCKDLSHFIVGINPADVNLAATRALNPFQRVELVASGVKFDRDQNAGSIRTVKVVASKTLDGAIITSKAGRFVTTREIEFAAAAPNLSVSVSTGPTTFRVADPVVITAVIKNTGEAASVRGSVLVQMAEDFVVDRAELSQADVGKIDAVLAGRVEASLSNLAPGAEVSVIIFGSYATAGDKSVSVTASDPADRDGTNDAATEVVVANPAIGLEVTPTVSFPTEVTAAETASAEYTVRNTTSYEAVTTIRVEHTSSDGGALTVTAATTIRQDFTVRTENNVVIAEGKLLAGESVTIREEVEYTAAGTITTTATVSAPNYEPATTVSVTTVRPASQAPKFEAAELSAEFESFKPEKVRYTVSNVQAAEATLTFKYEPVQAGTLAAEVSAMVVNDQDISRGCVITRTADGGAQADCLVQFEAGTSTIEMTLTVENKTRAPQDMTFVATATAKTGTDEVRGSFTVLPLLCEPLPENDRVSCSDGIDNDCDNLIDGQDPDCLQLP